MANKSLIFPDFEGVIFLSNLVNHFGDFNQDMYKHLEHIQDDNAFNTLVDDYFPSKFGSIDQLLDEFESVMYINSIINH